MATASELKERETRLEKDELNLETKRKEVERDLAKKQFLLDELEPRLLQFTAFLDDKRLEIEKAANRLNDVKSQIATNEADLVSVSRKVTEQRAALIDLDELKRSKQLEIEAELVEFTNKRVAEHEEERRVATETKDKLLNILADIEAKIDAKRTELDDLRRAAGTTRLTQEQEFTEHTQRMDGLAKQRIPLEAEIAAMETELVNLNRTRQVVIADTAKAREEHENFIDYEKRARKVLETKDRALLDKAQELAQTDRHLQAKRSFLADL